MPAHQSGRADEAERIHQDQDAVASSPVHVDDEAGKQVACTQAHVLCRADQSIPAVPLAEMRAAMSAMSAVAAA